MLKYDVMYFSTEFMLSLRHVSVHTIVLSKYSTIEKFDMTIVVSV